MLQDARNITLDRQGAGKVLHLGQVSWHGRGMRNNSHNWLLFVAQEENSSVRRKSELKAQGSIYWIDESSVIGIILTAAKFLSRDIVTWKSSLEFTTDESFDSDIHVCNEGSVVFGLRCKASGSLVLDKPVRFLGGG